MKKRFAGLSILVLFPALLNSQILGGAVAAYPFCGNANDIVGTNNGQVVGATLTADRFGNSANAYYFNGQPNCYINLGTSAVLKPLKGSVSVWARPDGFSNAGSGYLLNPIILTKNQPGNNCYEGYAIGLVNWSSAQFHTTATNPFCTQSNIIYPGVIYQNWYHIVMTWANDSIWLYINGSLFQKIYKGFPSVYLSSDSVMVGNSANTQNNRFFLGAIDDLVIFGTTITQQQVTALYNDASDCLGAVGVGEDLSPLSHLRLYPNPVADGQLFLDGLPGEDGTIEIFTAAGALVLRKKAERLTDVSFLRPGLYFLRYSSLKENTVIRFVVG